MKNKLYSFVTLAFLAGTALTACTAGADTVEKRIYVGPSLVDCEGVAPQKCLLVKENPEDEWTLFYGQIEGFDYEEGFEYELRVREETIKDPPADGSSIKWTLVEVVNKTKAPVTEAAASLEGALWTLASYVNSQGDPVSVLPNTEITAEFQDGQVNGSAGCNNYFVSYEAAGERLTIGLIGATQMFCGEPENVMEQESEYLAALQSAASYQITNGQLQIANADGETVLTFSVKEPMPLTGTTWRLTSYNNGKGGLVSVLGGTEITAVFGEDGGLTGSAGCNNYTASYEVAGDQITIGPVATTRMMCAEPEGIMEQERVYLVALESAAIYQIQGDRLEMRDAGGVRVLTFNAVSDAG